MILLPCPFCGGSNIDPEGWASTTRQGPACDDCSGSADTVELWNKRPQIESDAKVIAALSKAADLAIERFEACGMKYAAEEIRKVVRSAAFEQTAGERK